MTFYVENESGRSFDFDEVELAKKVGEAVLKYEGCPFMDKCEVSLVITDSKTIHEINKEQRGIDASTDVLSFPGFDFNKPSDFDEALREQYNDVYDPDTGNVFLGDIVIDIEHVFSQSEEYGHSVLREYAFLITHSMLHLCGYDHMEEDERIDMEKRQEEVLSSLSISR